MKEKNRCHFKDLNVVIIHFSHKIHCRHTLKIFYVRLNTFVEEFKGALCSFWGSDFNQRRKIFTDCLFLPKQIEQTNSLCFYG